MTQLAHRYEDVPDQTPRWRGQSVNNKRVAVVLPETAGDAIHYSRFLAPLTERGCHIVLVGPSRFGPLLSSLSTSHRYMASQIRCGEFDFCVPIASLPALLGIGDTDEELSNPYLAADNKRILYWRNRLRRYPGPVIALNWRGRPDGDTSRDIPAAAFAPLACIPHLLLVSVQKGATQTEISALSLCGRVMELGMEIDCAGTFLDTAAIFTVTDLVITSDTGTAHLAGALGVEAWVALTDHADCVWGFEPSSTAWYPSLRLFRQPLRAGWGPVIADMARICTRRQSSRRQCLPDA